MFFFEDKNLNVFNKLSFTFSMLLCEQEGNKWFILRKFICKGDERKIQVLRNCYELCEISLQTFFACDFN